MRDFNSDVDSDAWFTVEQLAKMELRGYPRTGRNWHNRAKAEGWKSREVESAGRKGLRTEYSPPPDVMLLIQSFLASHPDFFSSPNKKKISKSNMAEIAIDASKLPDRLCEQLAKYSVDDGLVAIDKYINVSGAAGPGTEVYEEAIVKVRIDARMLRERIGSNFSRIKIAAVSGDSMEPTLSHGDQVLVDTSCNRFVENAIYAIQQDGFLRFKRITLKLDGSIIVKSDASPDVETYSSEVAARFFVVGVVIPFKFGRFKI